MLDKQNPQSLATLLNDPRFESAVTALQQKYPDLIGMPERLLRREISRLGYKIGPDDSMLRMKFWFEHDMAMAEGRKMYLKNIAAGVMEAEYFWKYFSKPLVTAWIICPLMGYAQQLDEAVGSGMAKLREILELPIEDPHTGKLDHRLIAAQTRIIAMLDMRKNGAYTQKIEQRNLNLHASTGDIAGRIENLSMEEVEKRMKRLEKSERDTAIIEAKVARPVYTLKEDE